ncbi:OmpA family protein [Vibrio fluvialis]|uniref:OmpA family protein n=1 Tax=Vibrio fluvialis TaxID=676 RepID=UPI00192C678C|nr:OmpA family protein [Vibrio fluvialis]MBL4288511.1 OmpA family protein [Vibrio fluvialis]MBL4292827.1 OmpA family protein [Vibrio fluvialis]
MKIRTLLLAVVAVALSRPLFANEEPSADVYDYITTPVANQVDDLLDDDNDGVINARDKCPDTPSASKIDNDGCGESIKSSHLQQLHILFANDSSDIPPVFLNQIRQMADFLRLYPETSIELQGYASKVGKPEYNLALSKQRSEAVRLQLVRFGVMPKRIRIVGFGDTVLAVEGEDQVSHARNRRVTASVVGFKGEVVKEWTVFTTLPK